MNSFFFKKNKIYLISLLILGLFGSAYTKNTLKLSKYQSGPETIGLSIPPLLCVILMFFLAKRFGFKKNIIYISLFLFMILYLPFGNLLLKEVKPYPGDDFDYYLKYAQNMIKNKTLWGGDQIRFPNESRAYITQPGYRYFVALELLIFKKLYRFVSLLNIGIFITAVFFLFKTIHSAITNQRVNLIFSSLIILSIPYATKNILMGLPEWLTVVLLIFFSWFYFVKNKYLVAFSILALVPFMRQNMLPPVLITLLIHCLAKKN